MYTKIFIAWKWTKDETKNIALQNMSESNNAVGEMLESTSTFIFSPPPTKHFSTVADAKAVFLFCLYSYLEEQLVIKLKSRCWSKLKLEILILTYLQHIYLRPADEPPRSLPCPVCWLVLFRWQLRCDKSKSRNDEEEKRRNNYDKIAI